MKIDLFAMERMQSTWENLVAFNISESGVHPMRVEELLDSPVEVKGMLGQLLGYTQSNGTPELRSAIAALYPGATVDHVEVTVGGSEANFVCCWQLLEPGDEVVMMVPNYMQAWGLARAFGAVVREWPLRLARTEGRERWTADVAALETLVSRRTKLILLCNPNNPTGARFEQDDLSAICALASKHGAWILSDEIYRGAERDGRETSSVWGLYDRVLVTSGLSKAYGLPGLRIGWIVGPPDTIARSWSYHDYMTIGPAALSDRLATLALEPARRARILDRTRRIIRHNYPILEKWLAAHAETFSYAAPDAGAIAYVKYSYPVNSTALVNRLREEKDLLVVPGDHFGMDGYLRIGYGAEPEYLEEALGRLHALLTSLPVAV